MPVSIEVASPSQVGLWADMFAQALHRLHPGRDTQSGHPWAAYRLAFQHALGYPTQDDLRIAICLEETSAALETRPLSWDRVKGWAKATQVQLRPGPTLIQCQTALAHALGASGWSALPNKLKLINAYREVQAAQAQAKEHDRQLRAQVPVIKGDWVMEGEVMHPQLAKVKDSYYDTIAKEWVMDLIIHNADGCRIGRVSPRMGGPAHFEPCVPVAYWERVVKPEFPLERDRTGYRDWRDSVTVLPLRSAPLGERREALMKLALAEVTHRYRHAGALKGVAEVKSAALETWVDELRDRYANADDPKEIMDTREVLFAAIAWAEGNNLRARLADEGFAQIQDDTRTVEFHLALEARLAVWGERLQAGALAASEQAALSSYGALTATLVEETRTALLNDPVAPMEGPLDLDPKLWAPVLAAFTKKHHQKLTHYRLSPRRSRP